jgi:hypothetical protein
MREIHAKGVTPTRFAASQRSDCSGFQVKFALAWRMQYGLKRFSYEGSFASDCCVRLLSWLDVFPF